MELGNGPDGGALFQGEKGEVKIDRGVFESDPEELMVEAVRNQPKATNQSHMQNWLDCIKSRAKPIADVEIGHRSAPSVTWQHRPMAGRRLRWDRQRGLPRRQGRQSVPGS